MDERSGARQGLRLVSEPDVSSSNIGVSSVVQATTESSIRPGIVVNSKYLVGELIGEGGVGLVYEAQNLELDEKVALKCLRPEVLLETAMVARFAHEAKAAASIRCE